MKETKYTFADLAGSESQGRTNTTGDRRQEAALNNKSLLTFGKVITALAEGEKNIPYRESNLTKVLSDSLGGNSKVK